MVSGRASTVLAGFLFPQIPGLLFVDKSMSPDLQDTIDLIKKNMHDKGELIAALMAAGYTQNEADRKVFCPHLSQERYDKLIAAGDLFNDEFFFKK